MSLTELVYIQIEELEHLLLKPNTPLVKQKSRQTLAGKIT